MDSNRIFQQDQRWYFRIRGNAIKGPYRSFHDAERGLSQYVAARRPLGHGSVLRWLRTARAARTRAARTG
jgi:hypothetical protein